MATNQGQKVEQNIAEIKQQKPRPFFSIRNEKDEILAYVPRDNPEGYLYVCSKDLAPFDNQAVALEHAKNCKVEFSDIIARKDQMQIARVTANIPIIEQRICERMSRISQLANGYPEPALYEGQWPKSGDQSNVFLLIWNDSVAGYFIAADRRGIGNQEFQQEIKNDHFMALCYVGKGFMKSLAQTSLAYLISDKAAAQAALAEPLPKEDDWKLSKITEIMELHLIS